MKLQARDPDSIGFEMFDDTIRTTHFHAIQSRVLDGLIPDVVTWLANSNPRFQRSSRSDIFPNGWSDRMPVVKQLLAAVRTVKVRIEPRD